MAEFEDFSNSEQPQVFTESEGSFFESSAAEVETNATEPEQEAQYQISTDDHLSHFSDESPLQVYRREWNIRQDEKAAKFHEKHMGLLQEASNDTHNFYQKRTEAKEKQLSNNKAIEKKFIEERDALLAKSKESSNMWEQVTTYIDFKQQAVGRDTTRLRKLLIDLKH